MLAAFNKNLGVTKSLSSTLAASTYNFKASSFLFNSALASPLAPIARADKTLSLEEKLPKCSIDLSNCFVF